MQAEVFRLPSFERWLTQGELARLYGVSVRTVERWREQGCPFLRAGGRPRSPVRFRAGEVEQWLREG